jgi:V/A-type H+-transporting ATPase subunit E
MALEDILKKIKNDALLQTRQIKEETQREIEIRLKKVDQELEKEKKEKIEEIKKKAHQFLEQEISTLELALKKETLQLKQELIENIFSLAFKKIRELPPQEYREYFKKIILENTETGDEEVIVSKYDQDKFTPEFLESINRELVQRKLLGKLSLAPIKGNFLGGVILKGKDKERNCSLEVIFQEVKESILPQVSKILFS